MKYIKPYAVGFMSVSPSPRRAWIEILSLSLFRTVSQVVALPTEGVD